MKRQQTDIVIAGGGMIGLSLACLLAEQGRDVVVLERHEQPQLTDELALRVSALNSRSRDVLSQCGAWDAISQFRMGPYQRMEVWDKDSPAHIEFDAAEVNADDLGAIAENNVVEHFLWQQALHLGVDIKQVDEWKVLSAGDSDRFVELKVDDALLFTSLLVGADGGRSQVRQWCELPLTFWDYQQQGLVANIKTELPHQGVARQVFLPTGPLALLPTADPQVVSIVWSADDALAESLLSEPAERFAKHVETESGRVLGACQCVSSVKAFPLRMQYARQWQHGRMVLAGDAAHTIHPLAGQGANLGFADVKALAEQLHGCDLTLLKALNPALSRYSRARRADTQVMIAAMEAFKRGFGNSNPLMKGSRAIAFAIPNKITALKRTLAKIAL